MFRLFSTSFKCSSAAALIMRNTLPEFPKMPRLIRREKNSKNRNKIKKIRNIMEHLGMFGFSQNKHLVHFSGRTGQKPLRTRGNIDLKK